MRLSNEFSFLNKLPGLTTGRYHYRRPKVFIIIQVFFLWPGSCDFWNSLCCLGCLHVPRGTPRRLCGSGGRTRKTIFFTKKNLVKKWSIWNDFSVSVVGFVKNMKNMISKVAKVGCFERFFDDLSRVLDVSLFFEIYTYKLQWFYVVDWIFINEKGASRYSRNY